MGADAALCRQAQSWAAFALRINQPPTARASAAMGK